MAVKHSTASDATFSSSGATAWAADHTIENGTVTEAMLSVSDNTTKDVSTTAHGFVPKAPNDSTKFLRGDATWAVPTASAALSGISAATASNTIANGNNTGQVWNWANTTDSTVAFTFGETSAATGGTSTTGVPNQVLLKIATLAASTMAPLSVYSRGSHVFSVAATTAQIVMANGSSSAPTLTFAGDENTGVYRVTTDTLGLSAGGNAFIFAAGSGNPHFRTNFVGTSANPAITNSSSTSTGIFFPSSGTEVGIASGGAEIMRFHNATTGGGWAIMDEADSDPTTTDLDANDSLAIYNKNNKLVFAYNNAGTITYLTIPLDSSTTAWTQSTTAP